MGNPAEELRVAGARDAQLATPGAENGNDEGNPVATSPLKSLAHKVLDRNRPRNSVATDPQQPPQLQGGNTTPKSCYPDEPTEGAYADFLTAWQGWVGDQALGAWELIVAMDRGFAPRAFREAAVALFGELPATPYALGGYLAPYRGLGAAGLRLEDETVTNDAGERVRRYRVTGSDHA